MKITFFSEHSG